MLPFCKKQMNVKLIRRENMRALAKSTGGISKLAIRLINLKARLVI